MRDEYFHHGEHGDHLARSSLAVVARATTHVSNQRNGIEDQNRVIRLSDLCVLRGLIEFRGLVARAT